MSPAIDNLIEYILQHISLAGSQGIGPSSLSTITRSFYNQESTQLKPTLSTDLLSLSSATSVPWSPLIDTPLLTKLWAWLISRPEVLAGPGNEYAGISYEEALALEEQRKTSTPSTNTPISAAPTPSKITTTSTTSRPTKRAKTNETSANTVASICLFTTEDRMWHAVCNHSVDHKRVPPLEFVLLSIIASHGPAGIAQTELTRLSGQDKRSLPKRTDNLSKKGYIIKKSIINRGTRTSLLILRRFVQGPNGSCTAGDSFGSETGLVGRLLSADGQIYLDRVVDTFYEVLKDAKTLPVETIKQRLGFNHKTWPKRFFPGALRKLAMIGLIVRIKVKVEYQTVGKTVMTKALKLIRAPTERDRELFMSIGENEARENDKNDWGKRGESDDSDNDLDIAESETLLQNLYNPSSEQQVPSSYQVPQWDPDVPLLSLIFSAIHSSGVAGISSMTLRSLLFGTFWRRPFDTIMSRLTDAWERSQPAHLQQFVVIKDTAMTSKQVHFVYRTATHYAYLVQTGQTVWEAVGSGVDKTQAGPPTGNPFRPSFGKDSIVSIYQHSWGEIDQYGLPIVKPQFLVNGNGFVSGLEVDQLIREDRRAPQGDRRYTRRRKSLRTSRARRGNSVAASPILATSIARMQREAVTPMSSPAPLSIAKADVINRKNEDTSKGPISQLFPRRDGGKRTKMMADKMEAYRSSLIDRAREILKAEGEVDSVEPVELGDKDEPAGVRKRRRIGANDGVERPNRDDSEQNSTIAQKLEHIVDELYFRRRNGLYIAPPNAARHFKRGRPRAQLVVVFKLDQLVDKPIPLEDSSATGESSIHVGQPDIVFPIPQISSTVSSQPNIKAPITGSVLVDPQLETCQTENNPPVESQLDLPFLQPIGNLEPPPAISALPVLETHAPAIPHDPLELGMQFSAPPCLEFNNNSTIHKQSLLASTTESDSLAARASPSTSTPLSSTFTPTQPTPSSAMSRTHKKNGGLFIGGGLMGFNRVRILVELVTKCGGVAPGGSELYQCFKDEWVRQYGSQPDTKTMSRAMGAAVQSGHLKKYEFKFSHRTRQEKRSVVTLPQVNIDDPRISEMQKKIEASFPEGYMPPELGLGPRKRNTVFRDHYVLDTETRLDPEKDVPLWVQRHLENMRAIAIRRQATKEEREKKREMQKRIRVRQRGRPRQAFRETYRPLPIAPNPPFDPYAFGSVGIGNGLSNEFDFNFTSLFGNVVMPGVGMDHDITGLFDDIQTMSERLKSRTISPLQSLMVAPTQVYFPQLGVFGTFPIDHIVFPSRSRTRSQSRARSVKPPSVGKKAHIPFVSCNPRQTVHRATGTIVDATSQAFFVNRRVPLRSVGQISRAQSSTSRNRQSSPESDYGYEEPPTYSAPSTGSRRPRKTAPETLLAAVTGDASTLSDPKAKTITYQTKVAAAQLYVPEMTPHNRLLLAIVIIVQTLAGGLSSTINWAIVTKICSQYPNSIFPRELSRLSYRWRCLSKGHEIVVERFTNEFRKEYLRAYQNGEVDPLNYSAIYDHDWDKLVEWAMEKIDMTPMIKVEEEIKAEARDESAALPSSIEKLNSQFDIVETPHSVTTLPETFYNIKSLHSLRSVRVHETRFVVLYDPSSSPPSSKASMLPRQTAASSTAAEQSAYSLIRASITTPLQSYDPASASKRVSSLSVPLIETALRRLVKKNLITKAHSGGQIAPGRNWRVSDQFWTIFGKQTSHRMFLSASQYKAGLDEKFRAGCAGVDVGQSIEEGHMLALINMIESGDVSVVMKMPLLRGLTKPPELLEGFDTFKDSFLSPWGWLGKKYQTRRMGRELVYLPAQIVPRTKMLQDLSLPEPEPIPPPSFSLEPPRETGLRLDESASLMGGFRSSEETMSLIPIWRDIHTGLISDVWFRLVCKVVLTIAERPGLGVKNLETALRGMVEEWEILLLVDWLIRAKIVVQAPCRSQEQPPPLISAGPSSAEPTGHDIAMGEGADSRDRKFGLILNEYWWLVPSLWSAQSSNGSSEQRPGAIHRANQLQTFVAVGWDSHGGTTVFNAR